MNNRCSDNHIGVLVSVIIPVYCAQKTLRECLDSVLSQSIDLEVICVDDGSTDESLSILEEYAARDKRVRVLTQKNQYAGIARNKGLEIAQGKYVAFLDADDYYLPDCLSALYEQAERYKLDMLKAGFIYLDTQSGERYTTLYSVNSCISSVQRRRVIRFLQMPDRLLNVCDVPWNGLYRKAFLDEYQIRFNGLRCINDHSFYINCLLHAERVMVSPNEMACYRVEQKGSLVGSKAHHFENQIKSYYIVRELCREVSPALRRKIMGQELSSVFSWYFRLKEQGEAVPAIEEQLRAFVVNMDEEDAGEEFLSRFPSSGDYYWIRYGRQAPPRPHALARAIQCWREHGLRYTLARLMKNTERKWKA